MHGTKIESGLQLFSRLNQRPSLEKLNPILFSEGGPFPTEILEVIGSQGTGTDKTVLIMDFLARCLLPTKYNGIDLPGKNCGAVMIDTDHHFDMFKLIEIMELIIKKSIGGIVKLSRRSVEHIIESCLSNLIVLNCYDSQQMQITFLNLERILSENINVGLVVVDSISAYYWEYRNSNGIISLQNYYKKILESLQNIIRNSNVVLICTRADVDITLDVCYKIMLKEFEDKYQATVVYCNSNVQKNVVYKIATTINFVNG